MKVTRESRVIHGHRRSYLRAGSGPVLLLVHGIGDSSETWREVIPLLARTHTVIAPDLLGHGQSDKPRADYSLGGFANGLRDLLVLLGHESATVIGHSLGGGVALQFAYQFPERCERLVLVCSGGLGAEVSPVLRVASLPGASAAIYASVQPAVRWPVLAFARGCTRVGLLDDCDVEELQTVWKALRDRSTRAAFLRTLRSVVDLRGQAVSSRDRLYLTRTMPTMLIWGGRDPILPVAQAREVAAELPDVVLEVLPRAGHIPHRNDPQRFVQVVEEFLTSTRPCAFDPYAWRVMLASGGVDHGEPPALQVV